MEDVQGLQHLLGKLGDLESLVTQKKILVKALRAGGERIGDRMAQLAPDDPVTAGSRLKDNIKTRVLEQTATGAVARIGPLSSDAEERVNEAAMSAEFGSAHQSAEPFARPAFDEKKDEALRVIGEVLADLIESEARR